MKVRKIDGDMEGGISLDLIKFERIRTVVVSRNNKNSGKINFPEEEVGKTVYILYPKEG